MKIDINSIKKYFSKGDEDYSKATLNPRRDWGIIITIFTIIAIFIVAYITTLFWETNDDSGIFVIKDQESKIETINRKDLLDVLGEYKQKERFFEELKDNRPSFVDPSQ